jgi:hypothetical protein
MGNILHLSLFITPYARRGGHAGRDESRPYESAQVDGKHSSSLPLHLSLRTARDEGGVIHHAPTNLIH